MPLNFSNSSYSQQLVPHEYTIAGISMCTGTIIVIQLQAYPIPHFHSQSCQNYEYILLCTSCRIKCNQRILSMTVTITNIPPFCFLLYYYRREQSVPPLVAPVPLARGIRYIVQQVVFTMFKTNQPLSGTCTNC